MKHGERRRAQPREARKKVEVANDGNDAVRAELGDVLGATRQSVEADFRMEQVGGAQRDVAAADQQYPDHARFRPFTNRAVISHIAMP